MKQSDQIVIRFSGDSGDGMQLTGTQFSNTSAQMGNDLATFPDFPAEIRAPQGTVAGISGFQVHFGSVHINTPGDEPDVLVAMNPAALKANLSDLKPGGFIIANEDAFTDLNLKKAGYEESPLDKLQDYKLITAPITTQTKKALEDVDLEPKAKTRSKNFYALGMTYFMFTRDLEPTINWISEKFAYDPNLKEGNIKALKAGYNYAETIEVIAERATEVHKADIEKGTYRQISGNTALAWGFIYAAENAGLDLFLGSYPITPASDILHELSKYKHHGVKTFQAEDEIAACCAAVGASYAGALAMTTSAGPGVALKSEALNLALMLEIPLVLIDVQRGGPSTGLPTKTEQSDLNMVMYGRNGDSPLIVIAAKSPSDCFYAAFEAARLSIEHMTPVVLLSDGYIANGSTPWKIPDLENDFPKIQPRYVTDADKDNFLPYKRDAEKLARSWALPGTEGLMHRVGGLEKQDLTGNVSYDPANHQKMVNYRSEKVARVANFIPEQVVEGKPNADLLIISWGGTYGSVHTAVKEMNKSADNCAHIHLQYLNPMPKNVESIINKYKKILVCELNQGQLHNLLQGKFAKRMESFTKVEGKPFKVRELTGRFSKALEEL